MVAKADAGSSDYSVELRFPTAQEDTSLGRRPVFHGVEANKSTPAIGALPPSGESGPVRVLVDVDGVDISPLLRNPQAALGRDTLYWYFPHGHGGGAKPYAALRHKNLRLIKWFNSEKLELYDLSADISESKNLVSALPEKAKALNSMLSAWLRETEANIPSPPPPKTARKRKKKAID